MNPLMLQSSPVLGRSCFGQRTVSDNGTACHQRGAVGRKSSAGAEDVSDGD